jgi:hypothetical protein
MTQIVQDKSDIPDARFYVVAQDIPMSKRGKDNYIILPCMNRTEARIVQDNAQTRRDMKDIKVVDSKPPMASVSRDGKPVLWRVMSRYDATRWYTLGGFR